MTYVNSSGLFTFISYVYSSGPYDPKTLKKEKKFHKLILVYLMQK